MAYGNRNNYVADGELCFFMYVKSSSWFTAMRLPSSTSSESATEVKDKIEMQGINKCLPVTLISFGKNLFSLRERNVYGTSLFFDFTWLPHSKNR